MDETKISSGSDALDDFLEGGYEKDVLTTIFGPSGSGKTTLCMLTAISCARQGKKVLFIDAEGGFSLERMKQLCGKDINEVLGKIVLLNPMSFDNQTEILEKLTNHISNNVSLIIVDTITMFYRLELAKREDINGINNRLIWQVSYLKEIAVKNKIPIILTNQVYADFNKKDEIKMVGGDILKYSSKCIIKLEKLLDNKRKSTLITHRSIPEGKELDFAIINEGIIH